MSSWETKRRPARGDSRAGRARHGVDEAPVSDAGSTTGRNFRSVAGTNNADVIAVGVELAHPAAVAIAVIGIGIARGDGAADHGGADEAGTDAPAPARVEAMGRCGRDGGRNAAGGSNGSESESGNLGLERHNQTPSRVKAAVVVRMPFGRGFFGFGSNPALLPGAD